MKQTLSNFSISLIISILFGIITSLILAILKTNNSITNNVAQISISVVSIAIFFLFGFIFSVKQRKRGLLNGLILITIYLLIYFITNSFYPSTTPLYITISRNGAIMLGSLFGVNIASKDDQIN